MALTERQMQVLDLAADGLSNGEIAARLHVSEQTVKNHLACVYAGLDVGDRVSALVRSGVLVRRNVCGAQMECGRDSGHRGRHGAFRAVRERAS